jgi:hypothetical protein
MIAKEKLLELLKKGLDGEEKAAPIYTKHLEAAVFWAGLDDKNIKEAGLIFRQLAAESVKHKEIVLDLISYAEGAGKDAF